MIIPEEYKHDIENAISILRAENCSEIYLFGSIANGNYDIDSDIDLAVKGLNKNDFFHVYGLLLKNLKHSFDLVGLDYENDFNTEILNQGNFVRVY